MRHCPACAVDRKHVRATAGFNCSRRVPSSCKKAPADAMSATYQCIGQVKGSALRTTGTQGSEQ